MHDFVSTVLDGRQEPDWRAMSPGRYSVLSGTWQGNEWRHEILVVEPQVRVSNNTCYLEITGHDAGEPDAAYAQALADSLGVTVAFIFDVPNQPLFDMSEDDLIAHTFERFVETGDSEWPLLVPMVRSALAAIDVISDLTLGRTTHFVIGGASKRGWTAWLAAATGDVRIRGIVPVVFDNLNMAAQMKHQHALWNGASPMIVDYSRRLLDRLAMSAEGADLLRLVDPWNYLPRLRCPALVVNGSRDPYWTVDAARHYYDQLPAGSGLQIVGNMGHSIGEWEYRLPTVAAFVRRVAGLAPFPSTRFAIRSEKDRATIIGQSDMPPNKIRIWGAAEQGVWFADSEFFVDTLNSPEVTIPSRPEYDQAVYMEFEFSSEAGPIRLTSPAVIIPKSN